MDVLLGHRIPGNTISKHHDVPMTSISSQESDMTSLPSLSSESPSDKSSIVEMESYTKLVSFAKYLAWEEATPGHPIMNREDIYSELMLEMVKCYPRYKEYATSRFVAIMKQVMRNRVSELKYTHFVTHRKAAESALSMSDDAADYLPTQEGDPQSLYASSEVIAALMKMLSPTGKLVLRAILGENKRMGMVMRLATKRARSMSVEVSVKPRHIADALLIPESEARAAMSEIKRAYIEVIANG